MLDLNKLMNTFNKLKDSLNAKIKPLDFRAASKFQKSLFQAQSIIDKVDGIQKLQHKQIELTELMSDPDLKDMAKAEQKSLENQINDSYVILENSLIKDRDEDKKSIIMEIRAGAGGNEASIFAAELLKVYQKYTELNKWKFEIIETSANELGGIKYISIRIVGENAYKKLQFESGVHRVQRIPVTESSGRLHTSTITVVVLPEPEEVDVNIDEKNMRIDTFRASGAGGQHVNTTDSAIRITYTYKLKNQECQIVVQCQDERSQHENKRRALQMLKVKLYNFEKQMASNEIDDIRRSSIGNADRSEKAKTYNFPQNRLTDHRFNITIYKLDQLFLGNLDELIQKTSESDRLQKIENLYKTL